MSLLHFPAVAVVALTFLHVGMQERTHWNTLYRLTKRGKGRMSTRKIPILSYRWKPKPSLEATWKIWCKNEQTWPQRKATTKGCL